MPKIRMLLKIIVILVTCAHILLVSAQDPDQEQAGDLWSPVIAAAPGAILGLVNLALVSKLGSISNRGGIVDGFTRLVPGLTQDGQKKMMLFLGKHNIQVSNHKESEEGEEDHEEDSEEYFGDIHEDLGVDDYGKAKGRRKHKKDKLKKSKKVRIGGKHKSGGQEHKNHDNNQNHNKFGKQQFKDFSDISDPYSGRPYGNPVGNEYKSKAIKEAIAFQYPDIDQNQVYWPQTDESKTKSFKSLLKVHSKISKRPDLRHKMDGMFESGFVPVTTPTSTVLPSSPTTTEATTGYVEDSDPITPVNRPKKESPTITTYDFDEYEDSVEYQPNEYQPNDFETELEEAYSSFNKFNQHNNFMYEDRHFGHEFYPKLFRKKRTTDKNWTGIVPLQNQVKNSTKTVDFSDISPEMVKLLLSAVNELSDKEKNKSIERKDTKVSKKSDKKKVKQKLEVDEEEEDEDKDPKTSSSNRLLRSRKPDKKKQSIAFIPIEKYQNILNLSEDRKQDQRVNRRRKNANRRQRYNEEEEEDTDEDNGEEYYDNGGDDEGYDEFFDDEPPVEGHSTVQKIEIPDDKYNYGFGFGSWFKRMFTFRSHPFGRTN